MSFQIPRGFKFIISGGLAAMSKLIGFLILFSFFHVYYLMSSALAFAFSVVVGFYMQKYFTFENYSKEDAKKQATKFAAISLLNLLINIMLMYFFVEMLNINEILAQIITIGTIACWNFFVYQKFVFNPNQ